MADPKVPSRAQLARMAGNDPELIRLLEQLFQVAGSQTPDDIDGVAVGLPVDVAGQIGSLQAQMDGLNTQINEIRGARSDVDALMVGPPAIPPKRIRYGQFYDTTTQVAALANTAYTVSFDTTDLSSGVYLSGSQVTVDTPGVYNFQVSVQLDKTSGGVAHFYLWFAKGGVAIANSASSIRVQGNDAEVFSSVNLFIEMSQGEYVELKWAVDDVSVQLQSFAAVAPVPAIPSVILTVSNNMENSR